MNHHKQRIGNYKICEGCIRNGATFDTSIPLPSFDPLGKPLRFGRPSFGKSLGKINRRCQKCRGHGETTRNGSSNSMMSAVCNKHGRVSIWKAAANSGL